MKAQFQRNLWRITMALTVMILSACATAPGGAVPQTGAGAIPPAATGSRDDSMARGLQIPPEVSAALLPSLLSPSPSAAPAPAGENRFDVAANNTPVREFFMSLVEGTPYNMVVHPDVAGTVSLTLKSVTIPEVMAVMCNVYGYEYTRTASGFQVLPAGLQTRTFHVNYLNLVRKGLSQTRVSSGQVSEGASSSDDDDDNDDNNQNKLVSGSRIDTESNADFWGELQSALRTIVGTDDGRRVVVQPQAGIVVVRALPAELRQIESYLSAIQGNMQRQVILEAKILEVELSDGYQTGVNWVAFNKLGDGKTAVWGQTGGGSLLSTGTSELEGAIELITGASTATGGSIDSSGFGGAFGALLNIKDFAAFIELLQTQGDVNVLSSPRVATVNNQKAVIKVGSDEFFVTDISSDTVTGTTTTASNDITLTPFFSGIALDVTPQIDPGGGVTLHIHPTVSEVTDQAKSVTVGQETQTIPLAFSTVRESDSIVHARSGQVVVIGGLMKEQRVNRDAGIPLLSRIPWAGALFRHTQESKVKSELVILLRPIVVQSDRDWQNSVDQSMQRLQGLEGMQSPGGSFIRQW